MIYFYLALGGFFGAIFRYVISKKFNDKFPFGTFVVNMIGSFLLGYFVGVGVSKNAFAFLGSGFCGAFTTFSTLKLEAMQLAMEKGKRISLFYILVSYLIGIILAFIGYVLANGSF